MTAASPFKTFAPSVECTPLQTQNVGCVFPESRHSMRQFGFLRCRSRTDVSEPQIVNFAKARPYLENGFLELDNKITRLDELTPWRYAA